MATDTITLVGIAEWARVFEHNRDREGYQGAAKATDGQLSIDLLLDQSQFDILKNYKSGKAKNKMPDENGKYRIKLTRPWNTARGWDSGPVPVTDKAGTEMSQNTGVIPNGSKVAVTMAIYDCRAPVRGTRLDAVSVLTMAEMPDGVGPSTKKAPNTFRVCDTTGDVIEEDADGNEVNRFQVA